MTTPYTPETVGGFHLSLQHALRELMLMVRSAPEGAMSDGSFVQEDNKHGFRFEFKWTKKEEEE